MEKDRRLDFFKLDLGWFFIKGIKELLKSRETYNYDFL